MNILRVDGGGAAAAPAAKVGPTIPLGGSFTTESLLPRDGRDPNLPNGLEVNQAWVVRRVSEVVALHDNPVYSFFRGVEAMTRQPTRTTKLFGLSAVSELFHEADERPDQWYHRMPGNTNDRERDRNADGQVTADFLDLSSGADSSNQSLVPGRSFGRSRAPRAASAKREPRQSYPVVGKVKPIGPSVDGDDEDDDGGGAGPQFGAATTGTQGQKPVDAPASQPLPESATAAAMLSAGQPVLAIVPTDPQGLDPSKAGDAPVVMTVEAAALNATTLRSTAKEYKGTAPPSTTGSLVSVETKNPTINVATRDPVTGEKDYISNIEDGDVVFTRRLLSGQALSDADERMIRLIWHNGEGVTRPASRTDPRDVSARRRNQRDMVASFARGIKHPSDLEWAMLPEHLRLLFLTDEAAMALSHAVWFAHYQQPWDGMTPPNQRDRSIARPRQVVPALDLMTHNMVRVPFQSLVANIMMYWRQRPSGDVRKVQESLEAINGLILTLSTMRESREGFISLMGHYDLELQQSRFDLDQQRAREFVTTGRYRSDMNPSEYSRAQRPPVNGAWTSRHRALAPPPAAGDWHAMNRVAVASSLESAPHARPWETLQDASQRVHFLASLMGGPNSRWQ